MELIHPLPSFMAGLLAGFSLLYVTAYLKEKGKLRALQETVKSLEEDKQKTITKYQKEIEDVRKAHQLEIESVKKNHQLDIEKRKHRYESKKSQYYQFMQEMDEFYGCLARVHMKELSQLMLEYYGFTNNVSRLSQEELTVKFNELALSSVGDVKIQVAKLYSKLNAFKLSANAEIISLLEDLMIEIQKSEKNLVEIFTYIGTSAFQISRNVPEEILKISDSNASNVANIKEKLMIALRCDLDEI